MPAQWKPPPPTALCRSLPANECTMAVDATLEKCHTRRAPASLREAKTGMCCGRDKGIPCQTWDTPLMLGKCYTNDGWYRRDLIRNHGEGESSIKLNLLTLLPRPAHFAALEHRIQLAAKHRAPAPVLEPLQQDFIWNVKTCRMGLYLYWFSSLKGELWWWRPQWMGTLCTDSC